MVDRTFELGGVVARDARTPEAARTELARAYNANRSRAIDAISGLEEVPMFRPLGLPRP